MGLYRFIFTKLLGWRLVGQLDPTIKKALIIVVPHTSWHDFYIGVLVRGVLGVQINFVGKKELFKWPFGAYFRWMGGAPLDRSKRENKVQAIAAIFDDHEEFRMAMAPEGTRKKVETWKTGFYFIAREAGVPIIPVAFDYGKKQAVINQPFYPSGAIEDDMPKLRAYYEGVIGKVPAYS